MANDIRTERRNALRRNDMMHWISRCEKNSSYMDTCAECPFRIYIKEPAPCSPEIARQYMVRHGIIAPAEPKKQP